MKLSNYNDAVSHPNFDNLLNLAQVRLEKKYQENKHDVNIIRNLADIYRKRGLLGKAKNKFVELVDSGISATDGLYLKQIFCQEPLTIDEDEGVRASPFVLIDNFLSTQEQLLIWKLIDEFKDVFEESKIEGRGVIKEVRDSKVIYKSDLKKISDFFLPKIRKGINEKLNYLLIKPFEIKGEELQLTLHTDGDFFKVHKDAGINSFSRKVTFVYYFHREPKSYLGGDLLLYDTDKNKDIYSKNYSRIKTRNNLLILFPSYFYHQVTPVNQQSDDPLQGRFTLNGWIHGIKD